MAPGYGRRLWSLIVLVLRPRPSSSTLSPLRPRSIDYEDEDEGRGRSGKMRVTMTGGRTPPKPRVEQNSRRVDQNSFQSGPKVGCRDLPILALPAQSGPKVPEWTTILHDLTPTGAAPTRPTLASRLAGRPRAWEGRWTRWTDCSPDHPHGRHPQSIKSTPSTIPTPRARGTDSAPAASCGHCRASDVLATRSCEEIWRLTQAAEPCSPAPGSLALAGERPRKSETRSTKSETPSRANTASAPAVPRLLMPAPPGVSGLQVQIPFGFRGSGFGFPALLQAMRASGRPGLLSVLYHTLRHCQALTYNFFRLRNIRKCKHLRFYTRMAKSSRAK